MSLPTPSPSTSSSSISQSFLNMPPEELVQWDAPLLALTQKSNGDLRKLLFAFFSFLHRRTDFYMVPHDDDLNTTNDSNSDTNINSNNSNRYTMGFPVGDAEKLLIAAFRQFPLRKLPPSKSFTKQSTSTTTSTTPTGTGTGTDTVVSSTDSKSNTSNTDINANNSNAISQETNHDNSNQVDTMNTNDNINNSKTNNQSHDNEPTITEINAQNQINSKNDHHHQDKHTIRYTEEGKQIPVGNGGSAVFPIPNHSDTSINTSTTTNTDTNTDTETETKTSTPYNWTQTLHEITIAIPLPPKTRAKDLNVQLKSKFISISLPLLQTHTHTLLEGTLPHTIHPSESTWTIENNILLLILDKHIKTWWSSILLNDIISHTIDTTLVDSKRHISDYDDATQSMIRRILHDQRQERLGLMTSIETKSIQPFTNTTTTTTNTNNSSSPRNIHLNADQLPPGVEYWDQHNFPPTQNNKK